VDGGDVAQAGGSEAWSNKSAAYRYLRKLVLTRQPALAKLLTDVGLMRPEAIRPVVERDGVPAAYGVYSVPLDADWEDAWRRTEGLLARLLSDVQEAGATLTVAVLTTREEIYKDTWDEILATHPLMRERQWDLSAPEERILAWCAANGVPCLNLDAAFVAARDSGAESLHYRHDGHWTPAGHEVAASALNEFIKGQHLLPMESGGMRQ
jgi:hypothetical protein